MLRVDERQPHKVPAVSRLEKRGRAAQGSDMEPHAGKGPDDRRDALWEARRAELVKKGVPAGYKPWLHLLLPSLVALVTLVFAIARISDLRAVELWTIPITYIAGLGFEWRAHKDILHRRLPILSELYERHERTHHVIYTADDMAMRSQQEWMLVLMPWFAIVLIIGMLLPVVALVSWVSTPNCAMLSLCTSVLFFLQYEWMHLSYHLPTDHPVSKLWLVRVCGALHTSHHDPRNMKRWNFNVTIPLFDLLHGTLNRDALRRVRSPKAPTTAQSAH